jgi:hypothetical protein
MAYWICDKCKLHYPARNPHKMNQKCHCGGNLTWHEKILQITDEESNIVYKEISPFMQRLISDYECAISRIILNCVDELYFPVGIKITMLILQGVQTPFLKKHQLHELETYSMLSNFSQNDLLSIIDTLIDRDYLKIEHVSRYDNKPVSNLTDEGLGYVSILKLTDTGKEFKNNQENSYLGFMEKLEILKG